MSETNRSKKAAHFGALAERAARERYGLDAEHDGFHDAVAPDGTPVEIKAAMLDRASGKVGRFRIFEDYHKRLRAAGGWYVFVAYRARPEFRVARMRSVGAGDVSATFYGAGGHRGSRQVKLPVSDVFD
jgi:hypothetical protein